MNREEFEEKLKTIPEVEPDEWDKEMLARIEAETDHSTISHEELMREIDEKFLLNYNRLSENAKEAILIIIDEMLKSQAR